MESVSREFVPSNVLVTGGAGFIGSNFIHYILSMDDHVRVVTLDKLTYAGSMDNLKDLVDGGRHVFVKGDITNRELVDHLLEAYHVDMIVNFAAESHVDRSILGPLPFVVTNVLGTATLLEAARRFWFERSGGEGEFLFHHISTDEVYGMLGDQEPPFTELTPYTPNSPYSASKAGSDHLVRAYHHTYGLPVVTTNCSNNYGPRQHSEKLIPTVVRSCMARKPIPVYGNGRNVRDWLHVLDHCRGIHAVIRNGRLGETYNIGGNNEWANIDLVRTICKIMDELSPYCDGHESLICFVTDRLGHDWRYAIDSTKIASQLGWCPEVKFHEGLRQTVEWMVARPDRYMVD